MQVVNTVGHLEFASAIVPIFIPTEIRIYLTGEITDGVAVVADFTVNIEGSTVTPSSVAQENEHGGLTVLTFTVPHVYPGQAVTVAYTKPTGVNLIAGVVGSMQDQAAVTAKTTTLAIAWADVYTENPNEVVIQFDEPITAGFLETKHFEVKMDGIVIPITGITQTAFQLGDGHSIPQPSTFNPQP